MNPPKRHADWAFLSLLVGVALWHLWTLPRFFYSGDNFAPRSEVAHWLMTGQLGIDYAVESVFGGTREKRAGMLEQRGQYFFENDAKKRFYSKYGIGYTLLYLLPLGAQKLIAGQVALMDTSRIQILLLGLYQILFSLATAAYLYALAGLYAERRSARRWFVFLVVYGTFLWHYLRAPTLEVFQVVPVLGFVYHMIRFLRLRREAPSPQTVSWAHGRHLFLAMTYVAWLLTLKVFFGFLAIIGGCFALEAGPRGVPLWRRIVDTMRGNGGRYALWMGGPLLLGLGLVLWSNAIRFGHWLNMGYSQWVTREGIPHDHFHIRFVPEALSGYFLRGGNTSAYAHSPTWVVGWIAIPWFWRKHREEGALIGAIFFATVLAISAFYAWTGEWCYGPRYLLHALTIGSVPLARILDRLPTVSPPWLRRTALAAMILLFGWSCRMQIYINAFDYFVYHRVAGLLSEFKLKPLNDYFARTSRVHRGYFCRDVLAWRDAGAEWEPLTILQEAIPRGQKREEVLRLLVGYLHGFSRPNFFLAEK